MCLEKPLANIGGEEGTQEEKNNKTTSVYKIKCTVSYISHTKDCQKGWKITRRNDRKIEIFFFC